MVGIYAFVAAARQVPSEPRIAWNIDDRRRRVKHHDDPGAHPQGESFLGRKWLIGKKIKKELDKPEGISHAKMV